MKTMKRIIIGLVEETVGISIYSKHIITLRLSFMCIHSLQTKNSTRRDYSLEQEQYFTPEAPSQTDLKTLIVVFQTTTRIVVQQKPREWIVALV